MLCGTTETNNVVCQLCHAWQQGHMHRYQMLGLQQSFWGTQFNPQQGLSGNGGKGESGAMAGRGCGFQRTAVDWTWTSTHVTCWIEIPLQGTAEVRTLFTRLPSGHRAPQRAGAPPPADCAAGGHSLGIALRQRERTRSETRWPAERLGGGLQAAVRTAAPARRCRRRHPRRPPLVGHSRGARPRSS